jgi:hypothetical protein
MNLRSLLLIVICPVIFFIFGCSSQNDKASTKTFKEALVKEIELATTVVVIEHDWQTDYDVLPGEKWGIRYKELRLNSSEIEELLEIVKSVDDVPYMDAMPGITSFHHTIIFERNGGTTYLKISTVSEVCNWNGSMDVPPEKLCRALILFLERMGLETSSSEATWRAKLRKNMKANQ